MRLPDSLAAFNAGAALRKSRLLPVKTNLNQFPITCGNCSFINRMQYNFCTNCGYPVRPNKDRLALYNIRLHERKDLQKKCFIKIAQARNALYLLAAFSMLGIVYLLSNEKRLVIKGVVMVLLAIIYAGLGKWSLQKPFTSLLISLIILLTFFAINTLAELTSLFTTAEGAYTLIVQLIFIHFLLQGVKGAFRSDMLEEAFKL